MSLFSDLGGTPLQWARLVVPFSGIWHADVRTVAAYTGTGIQVLNFAGVKLSCAPIRQISFTNATELRLVGGSGGWRTTVAAKQYNQPLKSTVISDLARTVKELVAISTDASLGPAYIRRNAVASDVLNDIFGEAWWVDYAGVLHYGTRPPATITSDFTCANVHGAAGIYEVATESPGDWIPGAAFKSSTVRGTVNRAMHVLTSEELRTEIMVS